MYEAALKKRRNGSADDGPGDGRNQKDRLAAGGATTMPGEAFATAGVNSRRGGGQVITVTRVPQNLQGSLETGLQIAHSM